MSTYYYNSSSHELYHSGVKGMKWGVRRAQKKITTFNKDGSKKTNNLLNKLLQDDMKYGPNRTIRQDAKINKQYKKLDQSFSKDIKTAKMANDEKLVKSISSGKTYMKLLVDGKYLERAVNDAAIQANAKIGEKYTYKVTRNEKSGFVDITVNGVTNSYSSHKF